MSATTRKAKASRVISTAEHLCLDGQTAMNAGNLGLAETCFRRSHFLQPNALAASGIGYTLLERVRAGEKGLTASACEWLASGYSILGDAFYGLGYADALTKLDCHDAAREVLTAITRQADDGRNLPIIAKFLLAHLNAADGLPSVDDFLALKHVEVTDPYAKFYRALIRLWDGDWEQGWADYHERWNVPALRTVWRGPQLSDVPMLTREQATDDAWLKTHTVLIWQEQGLGDVAFGMRWLPVLDDRHVQYRFAASTHGLEIANAIRTIHGHSLLTQWTPDVKVDAQCPLFSVPHLFAIPEAPPAIRRIEEGNSMILLKLTGNARHGNDADRSCHDPVPRAFAVKQIGYRGLSVDLDTQPTAEGWSWRRTVKEIAECRALLTVDTAVANIAAVLGVPTILIPQTMPEFRWGRYDTVRWAPSVTIVRRPKRDAWLETLAQAVTHIP